MRTKTVDARSKRLRALVALTTPVMMPKASQMMPAPKTSHTVVGRAPLTRVQTLMPPLT
jgi:hypothetical protein